VRADVARVRLYLRPAKGSPVFRFTRPGGVRDAIPALWVFAYVDLIEHVRPGRDACTAAFPDCIIDIGSHLSVIPERIWGQFQPGVVTPLPFDQAMPPNQRVFSFGGGTWPYELGELTIHIRDLVGGSMTVKLVAQLSRDGGRLMVPMVLGLRGGVIDGRILRSEPDPAAHFGEAWFLEDP
jgi:hypothetical protein